MTDTRAIEQATAHRPWPLPGDPWVLYQEWHDLLFAHWRVPAAALRPLVPPELELDRFDGSAWLGITPFMLRGIRPRGLPAFPPLSDFPELNVRTYVRMNERPGVFFFSLDAASRAAVLAARSTYRLPYHHAAMRIERDGDAFEYGSVRDGGDASFRARYRSTGAASEPVAGTLEHFLVERYALYAALSAGGVLTADIHHRPWLIQPAEADIAENTMAAAAGIELPDEPPLLHFAKTQATLTWLPRRPTG